MDEIRRRVEGETMSRRAMSRSARVSEISGEGREEVEIEESFVRGEEGGY